MNVLGEKMTWHLFKRNISWLMRMCLFSMISNKTTGAPGPGTEPDSMTYTDVTSMTRPMSCLEGWTLYREGEKCFKAFNTLETWKRARKVCNRRGGLLAIVPDVETYKFVGNMFDFKYFHWMGLYEVDSRTNTGMWITGARMNFSELSFAQDSTVPVVSGGCVGIKNTTTWPVWRSRACSETKRFICQKDLSTYIPTTTYSCNRPWTFYDLGQTCLLAVSKSVTWSTARDTCHLYGAQLVKVINAHMEQFVRGLMTGTSWIGLTERGMFHPIYYWLDEFEPYSNFHAIVQGDPPGECVAIEYPDEPSYHVNWLSIDCSATAYYVCQKPANEQTNYNTNPEDLVYADHEVITTTTLTCPSDVWILDTQGRSCLVVVQGKIDRETAADYCLSVGSHIVIIPDQETNDFVHRNLSTTAAAYWIGVNDIKQELTYVWPDRSPATYTNWQEGQPHNHAENEDCVIMVQDSGEWKDTLCNEEMYGTVCQYRTKTPQETFEEYVANGLKIYLSRDVANASSVEDRCAEHGLEELLLRSDWQFEHITSFLHQYSTALNLHLVWLKTIIISSDSYRWNNNKTRVAGKVASTWCYNLVGYPYQNGLPSSFDVCTTAYSSVTASSNSDMGCLAVTNCLANLRYICVNSTEHTTTTESPTTTTRVPQTTQTSQTTEPITTTVVQTSPTTVSATQTTRTTSSSNARPLPTQAPTSPLTTRELQDFKESLGLMTWLRDDYPKLLVADGVVDEDKPLYKQCPCACRPGFRPDLSEEALNEMIAGIQKALKVDPASLSATRNKKISAPDERASSEGMGMMAVLFLIFPAAFILSIDLIRVYQFYHDYKSRRVKVATINGPAKQDHEPDNDDSIGPFEPFTYC